MSDCILTACNVTATVHTVQMFPLHSFATAWHLSSSWWLVDARASKAVGFLQFLFFAMKSIDRCCVMSQLSAPRSIYCGIVANALLVVVSMPPCCKSTIKAVVDTKGTTPRLSRSRGFLFMILLSTCSPFRLSNVLNCKPSNYCRNYWVSTEQLEELLEAIAKLC